MGVGVPSGGTHFEKNGVDGWGLGHLEIQKKLLDESLEYSLYILGESQALSGGCTAVGQDDCLSG